MKASAWLMAAGYTAHLALVNSCTERIPHTLNEQPCAAGSEGCTSRGVDPGACALPPFPDETTTGWRPTGVRLSPYTGAETLTTPGMVLDGVEIDRCLRIAADNVTLRRSLIRTAARCDDALVHIEDKSGAGVGGYTGIRFEDVELDGLATDTTPTAGTGIRGGGFTALRVDIHHVQNGVRPTWTEPTDISESYLHDFVGPLSAGSWNALLSNGNSNLRLAHNNLNNRQTGGSAIALYGDYAQIDHVEIQGNLLNGGDTCLYAGSSADKPFPLATYVRVENNCFGRSYFRTCGFYRPVILFDGSAVGSTWAGNQWQDTGQAVPP